MLLAKLSNLCSDWSRRSSIQFVPVAGEDMATLSELLAAEHIKIEFMDVRVDLNKLVGDSTLQAKNFVKVSPFFFFGLAGTAKSSLINAFLAYVGGKPLDDPLAVSDNGRGTIGIHLRSVRSDQWATPGINETVVAIDTQGWELDDVGKGTRLVDDTWKQVAGKDVAVSEKVLKYRNTLVVVIAATQRRQIEEKKYTDLLKEVCSTAQKRAGGIKPTLVVVFTMSDLIGADKREAFKQYVMDNLNAVSIKQIVELKEPMFVSGTEKGGTPEGLDELVRLLKDVSKRQLESLPILDQVRRIMHDDCLLHLKRSESESPSDLTRRLIWADARAHQITVKNLHQEMSRTKYEHASKLWKLADSQFNVMQKRKFSDKTATSSSHTKDAHVDPTRKWHGDNPVKFHTDTSQDSIENRAIKLDVDHLPQMSPTSIASNSTVDRQLPFYQDDRSTTQDDSSITEDEQGVADGSGQETSSSVAALSAHDDD